jgi:signal transduction histidine kinase/ActR/RegA family two-component response regulator
MKTVVLITMGFMMISILVVVDRWQAHDWLADRERALSASAQLLKVRIENTISARLNAIEALAALFTAHPETGAEDFRQFASHLLQANPPIRALQFADAETRIKFVYPSKGNEITISQPNVLLADAKRGPYVKKAIATRQATLQGPFALRQGGRGVVMRTPILNAEKFIGLAIGVFDLPVLISESMDGINRDELNCCLLDNKGTIFFGNGCFGHNAVRLPVAVADQQWTLMLNWVAHAAQPPWPNQFILWCGGLGCLIMTLVVIQLVWWQVERIKKEREHRQISKKLRQSQKMEAIGTLAGGIAHDFNNILSAILGYTELAQLKLDDDNDIQKDLHQVIVAGNRAKDLVAQILTFSRQTEQALQPVQIKIIIKETLKLLRASLPTTIEIKHKINSNAYVFADATRVHQVILNLCTNAAHAMRENGGILEIALESLELDAEFTNRHPGLQPGYHVRLTVSDDGCGIAPDIMERIFDPFFTTKEKGDGTGMGLSVVHGIVKSHGGIINAYSVPGKGTSFHVFLPAIERRVAIETRAVKELPMGTERILLVDDEEPLCALGKAILETQGYRVTATRTSSAALSIFQKNPHQFDLIVTDLTMPKLTGDRLAIEALKIRSDIPIILCTGFSATVDEDRAKAIGIRAFVQKPILRRQICTTVRQVLDQAQTMGKKLLSN